MICSYFYLCITHGFPTMFLLSIPFCTETYMTQGGRESAAISLTQISQNIWILTSEGLHWRQQLSQIMWSWISHIVDGQTEGEMNGEEKINFLVSLPQTTFWPHNRRLITTCCPVTFWMQQREYKQNKSSQWLPNTPFASISECLVS